MGTAAVYAPSPPRQRPPRPAVRVTRRPVGWPAVETVRGGTFRSLRTRNFRLFVIGQAISATGFWMQSVAAPFLVLQLTHSGIALGIDAGLTFLPILLFGAWGGLLADRFDNRRLQLATQVAYAIPAATLWLLLVT